MRFHDDDIVAFCFDLCFDKQNIQANKLYLSIDSEDFQLFNRSRRNVSFVLSSSSSPSLSNFYCIYNFAHQKPSLSSSDASNSSKTFTVTDCEKKSKKKIENSVSTGGGKTFSIMSK